MDRLYCLPRIWGFSFTDTRAIITLCTVFARIVHPLKVIIYVYRRPRPQTAALANLTVIDLSHSRKDPFAAQNLRTWGQSDQNRASEWRRHASLGPPFVERDDGLEGCRRIISVPIAIKTNLSLDFTQAADRERLIELIKIADIVIENYKVGGLAKYGLITPRFARSTHASFTAPSPVLGKTARTKTVRATMR